jgi:hypothetical protein
VLAASGVLLPSTLRQTPILAVYLKGDGGPEQVPLFS